MWYSNIFSNDLSFTSFCVNFYIASVTYVYLLHTMLGKIVTLPNAEELGTIGEWQSGAVPPETFLRITFFKSHRNTLFALELRPF